MHKSNRLFPRVNSRKTKCLAVFTAILLLMTTLSLPLFARNTRDGKGMMGEIRDGVRQFGREVSDMVDPDGDGILPDGSIDNGIQNDGNQNNGNDGSNSTPNVPGAPSDTPNNGNEGSDSGILPGVTNDLPGTTEDRNDPTPGTDDANRTDEATPGTTAPTTTQNESNDQNDTTNNDDTAEESGFRWTGIIIALVAIAAVVGIIILLIPKRKD